MIESRFILGHEVMQQTAHERQGNHIQRFRGSERKWKRGIGPRAYVSEIVHYHFGDQQRPSLQRLVTTSAKGPDFVAVRSGNSSQDPVTLSMIFDVNFPGAAPLRILFLLAGQATTPGSSLRE